MMKEIVRRKKERGRKQYLWALLVILCFCLLITVCPAMPGAAAVHATDATDMGDGTIDNLWNCGAAGSSVTATLSADGTLTISGTGDMADYQLSSANSTAPWKDKLASIKSVTIGKDVTSIGEGAFYRCSNLESVTFPNGSNLTTIKNSAFAYCGSLTSITIPNTVTTIGNSAFQATGLTSITIPNSVKLLDGAAFYGCNKLASVTLPTNQSFKTIDTATFFGCGNLTEITIPGTVTKIGVNAFASAGLTKITIPNNVTYIDAWAFDGCSSLAEVTFESESKLTTIGSYAFRDCTGLTSVTIPSSVTSIGLEVFDGCTSLMEVIFNPTTPPSIEKNVFNNCGFVTDDNPMTGIQVPEGYVDAYKTAWATNFSTFADNTANHYHTPCNDSSVHGETGATCSHGKVEYIKLTDATTALTVGNNYYLAEDVTLNSGITLNASYAGGTVNICLNGHTLTGKNCAVFKTIVGNGADTTTVNICDCSEGKSGTIKVDKTTSDTPNVINVTSAALNVYGGTIEASGGGIYGVALYTNGALNMYGGKISTLAYSIYVYNNSTGTNINIYGGDIRSSDTSAIRTNSPSTIKISGGTISNTSTMATILNQGGSLTVTGGNIEQKGTGTSLAISNTGTTSSFTMSGGTVTTSGFGIATHGNTNNISGGTITCNNDGGVAIDNYGTLTISGNAKVTSDKGKAIVNGVDGETNSGVSVTIEGGTITSDFYALENNTDATATISGGDFTTSIDVCIYNKGKMEITGANSIHSRSYPVDNSGELTISGGTYNGNISNSGTLKLSGSPTFTNTGIRLNRKDAMIDIVGALTYTDPCKVTIYGVSDQDNTIPRTITSDWNKFMSGKQPSDYFKSDLNYCTVTLENNEGYIRPSKVTFDLNYTGCTNGEPVSVAANCKVAFPSAPTRTGYIFKGWYDAKTGGTQFTSASTFDGDTTLYAHWEECTHTFDSYTTTATTHTGVCTVCGITVTENHKFKYSVSYQTMYEKCDKGCGHRATATLTIPDDADLTYTGNAITPATITYSGDQWVGVKPTISYTPNINVGNVRVNINYGNIGGSTTFVIKPKSLTADMVTIDPISFPYTGTAVEPDVTVKDGETVLVKGTDYTVEYSNNTNPTEGATVTVTGKGNYSGEIRKTFTIKQIETLPDDEPESCVNIPKPSGSGEDNLYGDSITITPKDGWTVGTDPNNLGSSVNITEETGPDGKTIPIYLKGPDGNFYKTDFTYKLDKTPPAVDLKKVNTSSGSTLLDNQIIGKKDMVIKIPASGITDKTSDIAEVSYTATPESGEAKTGTLTLNNGNYEIALNEIAADGDFVGTIELTVKDSAGHTNTVTLPADGGKIIVEEHSPVVKPAQSLTDPSIKPNENDWYNKNFDITVTVTDDVDTTGAAITSGGIAEIQWKDGEKGEVHTVEVPSGSLAGTKTFTIPTSDGEHTYYVNVVDNAGNSSGWQQYAEVKVDTQKPVFGGNLTVTNQTSEGANISFTPTEGGKAYWIVSDTELTAEQVKQNGTALDITSGTAVNLAVTAAEKAQTVYVVLEDAAGNLSNVVKTEISAQAHTHSLTKVERVEPTETTEGNVEYWHCSGCGKLYKDEQGQNETNRSEVTIPATGDGEVFSTVITTEGVKIVGYSGSGTAAVEVPSVIDGRPVTAIGENAFANHTEITSVTIPGSVKVIGEGAFSGCTGLTTITIPGSVTTIGEGAFSGCTGLTTIIIPEGVGTSQAGITDTVAKITYKDENGTITITSVAPGSGTVAVEVPSEIGGKPVTAIGEDAFSGCTGLTSVTIPDSVTAIGKDAFSGCTGLTSVTIPDSVTTIGEDAFAGCTGLTSVTIPDSVTAIGEDAFSGCTGLTTIIIPEGVDTTKAGIINTVAKITYRVDGNGKITITSVTPGTDSNGGKKPVTIPDTIGGQKPEISDTVKEEMKNISHEHKGGTATCIQKAVCEICGVEYGDFAEHTLAKTEGVEPTRTADGRMPYWTCSKCGKKFSDENGATEITDPTIPATGHESPKSGDDSNPKFWILLMLMSMTALVGLFVKKRKTKRYDER